MTANDPTSVSQGTEVHQLKTKRIHTRIAQLWPQRMQISPHACSAFIAFALRFSNESRAGVSDSFPSCSEIETKESAHFHFSNSQTVGESRMASASVIGNSSPLIANRKGLLEQNSIICLNPSWSTV
jgi:hypothetical protein